MDRNRLTNKIGEGHVYVQYKSFCVRNRVGRIFRNDEDTGDIRIILCVYHCYLDRSGKAHGEKRSR